MIKIVLLLVIATQVSSYDGKDPIFGIEDYSIVKPLDFLSEIPIVQQIEEQAEQELNYLEHPEEVQQQEFENVKKQLYMDDDQLQLNGDDKDVKYWLNQLDKDGIDLSDQTPVILLQKKKKDNIIAIDQIQIDLTNPVKMTNKIRSETIQQTDYQLPEGNIIDHIEIEPQQFILITDYQIEFSEPKEEVVGFKVQKKINQAKDNQKQNHAHNNDMIDLSFDDDDELQIQNVDTSQNQQEINQYDAYDLHYDESEAEQQVQLNKSKQMDQKLINKQNKQNNQENQNNQNKQNNQNNQNQENQQYIDDQKTKSIVQKLKERVWNKIDDKQEQNNVKESDSQQRKFNEKLPQSYQQVDTDQKINKDIQTLQSIVNIPQEPNHQIQERLYFKPEDDIPQKQFIYEDVKFPEAKLQDHQINLEEQQLKEKLDFINNKVLHQVDQPKSDKQNLWDDVLEKQDKMYDIKGFQEVPHKPMDKQQSKTNEEELFDKVRQIIQPKQEPIIPTIQKAENTIIQEVVKKEGEEEETHKVSKEEYARMRQERIKQVHEELKQQFSSKKGTKQEIMKETKETPYVYESNYQDWKMSTKSQMSFVLIQQNIRGKKK